ncbi:MAG: protein kinase [Rhodobacterales bacterium]|nr:protein kinase [Rhodobacterales bacterium]
MRHRVGIGGFGEVYRATMYTGAVQLDVAVKLLHAEYALDEQAELRLRDEARFLAALRHPCIVRVIDLVRLDGRLALVTEFEDGEDVRSLISRVGPLPSRPGVEVLARVADALNAARITRAPGKTTPMNLTHRDIKPANILLGPHGGVTLLDFGIARTDALDRSAQTTTYAIVGSGHYTPPETILREPSTPAGDVWSLAVTVFEIITGTHLFEKTDLRSMARLFVRGDPRTIIFDKLQTSEIPPGLRQLLLDMLALDPLERPTSAQVMRRADDLVDALQGQSLRRWATDQTWPPKSCEPGELQGQVLLEQGLEGGAAAANEASQAQPSVRLPPQTSKADLLEDVQTDEVIFGEHAPDEELAAVVVEATVEPLAYRRDAPPPHSHRGRIALVLTLLVSLVVLTGLTGSGLLFVLSANNAAPNSVTEVVQIASIPPPTEPADETTAVVATPSPNKPDAEPPHRGSAPTAAMAETVPNPIRVDAPVVEPAPTPVPEALQPPQSMAIAPSAEPEAPPTKARAEGSMVVFNSDGEVEIRVDGILRGVTPLTVRLPLGAHQFEAMVAAHPETATGGALDILAGEVYNLNLKFASE